MKTKSNLLPPDFSAVLAAHPESPCLSLYQLTHRHHPGNQQDPLRFRHLVNELKQSLEKKYPADEINALLAPFEELGSDLGFWNHTLGGIAVFGSPGLFQVYGLQRPVPELAVVADRFHIKPLRRFLQSVDRFQVLGLSLHEIKLFEGNRDALDEIELAPGVPRTVEEAFDEKLAEPPHVVAIHGSPNPGSAVRQSHSDRKGEANIYADRFFRTVDRAVLEHHSRPTKLPLLLAALPEHHSLFREISHNPFLLGEGIQIHPDALPLDAFRERAWQMFEPHYQKGLMELADEFAVAKSKGLGLDDLQQIADAAVAGRIGTLLIEADREIAGRLDAATGKLQLTDLSHRPANTGRPVSHDATGKLKVAHLGDPEVDDVLDDLGELVLSKGGNVVVVPPEQMPTKTGAAATCRY